MQAQILLMHSRPLHMRSRWGKSSNIKHATEIRHRKDKCLNCTIIDALNQVNGTLTKFLIHLKMTYI